MFLRTTLRVRCTAASIYCQNVNARFLATQAEASKMNTSTIPEWNNEMEYSKAAPFSEVPGPSATSLILSNFPGGRFYKKGLDEVIRTYRKEYGNIVKFPKVFGNPETVISCDPEHYQIIFRTEGQWPQRPTFDTMAYFRKNVRPDIFGKYEGLLMADGKPWADVRSAVNPVMIQPKTTKSYIPLIDTVASEFLERIHTLRNPETNQLPENFEDEINMWALESIGVIGLDSRLGLFSASPDQRALEFIKSVKDFFRLAFDLEFNPSIWRIVKTPKFKQLMKTLDVLTEISSQYIDEARNKLEQKSGNANKEFEESILEKLLKIDPIIAKVMAMDMIFAGVDTTSSAFSSLIYLLAKNPDKQDILRQEILTVLPDKRSSFTVEKMTRLPYLRACIKESMRLLPTVNGSGRMVGRDIVLDGYQIPKGTILIMYSTELQREDKYYADAREFNPERWIRREEAGKVCPASAKSAPPFLYLPFGFGPRMCIGRRLAEMEIEILISKIVRNFYITWDHPNLKFKWTTLNVPDGKLMFTLKNVEK